MNKYLFLLVALVYSIAAVAQSPTQVATDSLGITRILYPRGAAYVGASSETGVIKIKLPQDNGGTRIRMRVEIFQASPDNSFSIWLSGRNMAAGWSACAAQLLATCEDYPTAVQFGNDGTNSVIWIGDNSSQWKSLRVCVAEVLLGSNANQIDKWEADWSISVDPNNSISAQQTVTNLLPYAQISLESIVAQGLAAEDNLVTRITYPGGASYRAPTNSENGAIKITFPIDFNAPAFRMRVEVYHRYGSFTLWVNGNVSAGTQTWLTPGAQLITSNPSLVHEVHFGKDSNNNLVVWIGKEDTHWWSLFAEVKEVSVRGNAKEDWEDGWNISLEDQSFTSDIQTTLTDVLPVAQPNTPWADSLTAINYSAGNVIIGTNNNQADTLFVHGAIRGRTLRATANVSGADFVFEPDYDLPALSEVEQFIKIHKHLPGIPPAKEMQEQGLDLAEMNIKLLQKVEELLLYTIEQAKLIDRQSKLVENQEKRIKKLEKQIK